MALIIANTVDETGQVVGKGISFPFSIIANLDSSRYSFLHYVDPYGNTYFNRLQIPALLRELSALECDDTSNSALFRELSDLARQCESTPHLYLRFSGD